MKFSLTPQQLQYLKTLLNRVQIQGNEVGAFVDIVNLFNRPFPEKKPQTKPKKEKKSA
jgi:hypothetical protein